MDKPQPTTRNDALVSSCSFFSLITPILFFQQPSKKHPMDIFCDMLKKTDFEINNGGLRTGYTVDSIITFLKTSISKKNAEKISSKISRQGFSIDHYIFRHFFKGTQFATDFDRSFTTVAQQLEDMFDICPACPYRNRSVGWINFQHTKQSLLCSACWNTCYHHRKEKMYNNSISKDYNFEISQCRQNKVFFVSSLVIVNINGIEHFLLIKNRYRGWGLPGGQPEEYDKDMLMATFRELEEEAGFSIDPLLIVDKFISLCCLVTVFKINLTNPEILLKTIETRKRIDEITNVRLVRRIYCKRYLDHAKDSDFNETDASVMISKKTNLYKCIRNTPYMSICHT